MTVFAKPLPQSAVASTPRRGGLLTTALAQLEAAFDRLNLDDGLRAIIRQPERELTVAVPIRRDDGSISVFTGYRVQHSSARGPCKGARHARCPRARAHEAGARHRQDGRRVRNGRW